MRRSHCPAWRGFTLIELLIVISIISLLLALMIPAVQMARESARRSQCANHLRQFGVAMAGFESQNGRFPSSMTTTLKGPLFSKPEFHLNSYMIDLLPMLGVGGLAEEYDVGKMFNAPGNETAIARTIGMGICPSSPSRETVIEDEIVVSLSFTRSVRENKVFSRVAKYLDETYSGTFKGGVIDYSIVINADKGVAERHGYQLSEKEKALGLRSMFPVPIESTDDLLRQIVPATLGPATIRSFKSAPFCFDKRHDHRIIASLVGVRVSQQRHPMGHYAMSIISIGHFTTPAISPEAMPAQSAFGSPFFMAWLVTECAGFPRHAEHPNRHSSRTSMVILPTVADCRPAEFLRRFRPFGCSNVLMIANVLLLVVGTSVLFWGGMDSSTADNLPDDWVG